jgi:hypothetical protein
VLELNGDLGPQEMPFGGEYAPDGFPTAARFAIGEGALNLYKADFRGARRSEPDVVSSVIIELTGMKVEILRVA